MRPFALGTRHTALALLAFALGILLMCGHHSPANASSDWLQGPNGNLGVSTVGGYQWYPAAIPDGSGGTFMVWHDERNAATTGTDIYAQHILGSGVIDPTWPPLGVALTTLIYDQGFPTLCTDGTGGAYVAWTGGSPGVFVQHVLGTGAVDPAWPPDGFAVSAYPAQPPCKIASDGSGGAYITWADLRLGSTPLDHRVYVAHLISYGPDPAWPADGVRASTYDAGQSVPAICTDGAGGVFVAWNDLRSGTRDIFANRMMPDGTTNWNDRGMRVCSATGNQRLNGASTTTTTIMTLSEVQSNAIAPDGSGGFLITWADERTYATTGIDVYVQRMTASGFVDATWPPNGAPACTAAGDQVLPSLLPDGGGGATVMWKDARPGTYVRHMTGTGGADGYVDGFLVDAQGTYMPIGVRDAADGAIVTYARLESGDYNLYAQHLLNSPNLQVDPAWPAAGLALSTHSGNQSPGTVVRDDGSGAIAIWVDTRDSATTGWDVYAQRALAAGTLPTGSVSVPTASDASEFLHIDPNPVRASANVRFSLPTRSRVRIDLYDVLGRRVLALVDGDREPGDHVVRSTLATGSLRDGVYYLRLIAKPSGGGAHTLASRRVVVTR